MVLTALHVVCVGAGVLVCALIATQFAALGNLDGSDLPEASHLRDVVRRVGRSPQAQPGAFHEPTPPSHRHLKDRPGGHAHSTPAGHDAPADADEDDDEDDDGAAEGPRRTNNKHVALAFYGLTRSLRYTMPSIRQNVFAPLRAAGYTYDVYLHTYDLPHLTNERSGEATALNTTEWSLLNPDFHEVTSQEEFLDSYRLPIKACETFQDEGAASASAVDYYADEFTSIRNLMCQLNSLATVTSMWRATQRDYHAVLYLRPDMLFNCPLPTQHLDRLRDNALYIADFHHWHGYNDRFAMGAPQVAGIWGDRLNFALATCMRTQVHAEMLVQRLVEHYHFEPRMVDFFFFRVRANGVLAPKDAKPKWVSHRIPTCDADMFAPFEAREAALAAEAAAVAAGAAAPGGAEDGADAADSAGADSDDAEDATDSGDADGGDAAAADDDEEDVIAAEDSAGADGSNEDGEGDRDTL